MQSAVARTSQGGSKPTTGDPRRPDKIHPYDRSAVNTHERSPDNLLRATLILGATALLTKVKLAAWASVITVLSALANMPFGKADSLMHAVSTVTFSVLGLLACYVVPVRSSG
jgi:hypothetical protein